MERQPQGGEHEHLRLVPPAEEARDEALIREGIEAALRGHREIDDRTARYIAGQLHEGQATALYGLASTGAIADDVHEELTRGFDQQSEQVRDWINWLGTYCLNREHKGPVSGWVESAAAADREEEEARVRRDLMERISAASVTTLGQIATVTTTNHTGEAVEDDDEVDVFPWRDAVRWRPSEQPQLLTHEEVDDLNAEGPDDEIGSAQDVGWFGLLRHAGRPGGIILSQNSYGFRGITEIGSTEELEAQWEQLQREYDAFQQAVRANRESAEQPDDQEHTETGSSHHPEIWVGSLSDYNNGRLHGAWLDATLDPDELHEAIAFMLRNSYELHAEEWAIMDYDDFCGVRLGEYESLAVVSRVANGIAEHGEAFARWVEYVGTQDVDALDRFEEHYRGQFDSTEAYMEHLLDEGDAYSFLDAVPEWLRPYVQVDVEMLARDSEIELHVAEAQDGRVYVFDPRV